MNADSELTTKQFENTCRDRVWSEMYYRMDWPEFDQIQGQWKVEDGVLGFDVGFVQNGAIKPIRFFPAQDNMFSLNTKNGMIVFTSKEFAELLKAAKEAKIIKNEECFFPE